MEDQYLVIDAGGSTIKSAIMTENEIISRQDKIPTPDDDLEALVEIIGREYDACKDKIKGIAIAAPGRINGFSGYFYHGGAIHCLNGLNLIDVLAERCPCRITVENDAKCAALAELWNGTMKNVENGLVIVIGTGLGGGLILNHKLYRGSHFNAGEIGMMPTRLDEPYQPEKGRFWVDFTRAHTVLDAYEEKNGIPHDEVGGIEFFQRVNSGDASAMQCLQEYCDSFAVGIISLQYALDLEKVSIGGGFSNEDTLLKVMRERVHHAFTINASAYTPECPEIELCHYRSDANLYGAVYHWLHPEA